MAASELFFDTGQIWTFVLLFARISGMLISLPGIGTDAVYSRARGLFALVCAASLVASGVHAEQPEDTIQSFVIVGTEALFGFLIGIIPAFIISSLSISGQVVASIIGLGYANMLDPSIGQSVSVLARINGMIGTLLFLAINGHHIAIRAATGLLGPLGLGLFTPNAETAMLLLEQFSLAFELAVVISAPIFATNLLAQFVLGLITKSVPQINIFIISLPLTVLLGLYIIVYSFPGLTELMIEAFTMLQETLGALTGAS